MYKLKLTVFAICFVVSFGLPVDNDNDSTRVKKGADGQMVNGEKVNITNPTQSSIMMDKSRSGNYPTSGGQAYYTIGQMSYAMPHYPTGWLQPQGQVPTAMRFRMPEEMELQQNNARTLGLHGLRPSLYSQHHNTAPQVYAVPASYMQPYDYHSTPYYGSSHYSSYPPYYRSVDEDSKPRQYWNYGTSDRMMTAVQPSVYYDTKYLVQKPVAVSNMNEMPMQSSLLQPTMLQSPMLIRSQQPEPTYYNAPQMQARDSESDFNVLPMSTGYSGLNQLRARKVLIDNDSQMQIPPNYFMEKLQGRNPFLNTQPEAAPAKAMEHQVIENWQPTYITPNTGFRNTNPMEDPIITNEDQVVLEPFIIPDNNQASRSAEAAMYYPATYPNLRQQMRNAQAQTYFDNMHNIANELELLVKEAGQDAASKVTATPKESSDTNELLLKIINEVVKNEQKGQPKTRQTELNKKDAQATNGNQKNVTSASDEVSSPSLYSSTKGSDRHV